MEIVILIILFLTIFLFHSVKSNKDPLRNEGLGNSLSALPMLLFGYLISTAAFFQSGIDISISTYSLLYVVISYILIIISPIFLFEILFALFSLATIGSVLSRGARYYTNEDILNIFFVLSILAILVSVAIKIVKFYKNKKQQEILLRNEENLNRIDKRKYLKVIITELHILNKKQNKSLNRNQLYKYFKQQINFQISNKLFNELMDIGTHIKVINNDKSSLNSYCFLALKEAQLSDKSTSYNFYGYADILEYIDTIVVDKEIFEVIMKNDANKFSIGSTILQKSKEVNGKKYYYPEFRIINLTR